jgi:hypothetical protein
MSERTWTISDLDGSNVRQVTLAEFKAEHQRKAAEAREIFRRAVAKVAGQS